MHKKIICLLISFALLFSVLFASAEIHHDCDCDHCGHCEICECIDICINLITAAAVVFTTVLTVIGIKFLSTTIVNLKEQELPNLTLVDLKVRLDN